MIHATWTDNRDVVPALNDLWANYLAPGNCSPANQSSIRNQNIYTAGSPGLVVGAGAVAPRGALLRACGLCAERDRRSAAVPSANGGCPRRPRVILPDSALDHVDADVRPSSIARTVFVSGTTVAIVKVSRSMRAAPGRERPAELDHHQLRQHGATAADRSVVNNEFHSLALRTPTSIRTKPDVREPTFLNPTFVNPTFVNPTFLNPTFLIPRSSIRRLSTRRSSTRFTSTRRS